MFHNSYMKWLSYTQKFIIDNVIMSYLIILLFKLEILGLCMNGKLCLKDVVNLWPVFLGWVTEMNNFSLNVQEKLINHIPL